MPLITPRKVMFSPDVMERLWKYIDNQIDFLESQSQVFKRSTLPEWTRLLKGIPKDEKKNFPFPNASNLVVQLIGTRVEQLLSRAMVMYAVDPLWTINALGDLVGQESEEQARVLEQFMGDMAIDPDELALYRKEEIMVHDGIAYGTAFMGFPWQYITEHEYSEIPGKTSGVIRAEEFKEFVKRDGPSPENIPIERILIDNKTTELEKARFVGKELILTREAVEDRIAFGIWSKTDGEKILASPDTGETAQKMAEGMDGKGIQTTGNPYEKVYKIHECYLKFVHDRKTFSIIAHYHKASKTKLSAVFNYFPKNMLPLEDLRFGYDGDSYLGYGFIEMLKGYQEEVSTLHNNRLDNEAIRNNVSFRIDPDSELASTLKFFPGVAIPAKEGEIDVLDTKAGALDNMQSESASISMTNERSGIDPAISGNGSGVVNNKRGIYSSQGTLAVLQQQNNRTGLRMMDIRTTHTKIGRKLLEMYANIGIGPRLGRYGAQAEILRKALDSVKAGNLGLTLKASSAASNVESDRQNSVLLAGLQEKYIGTVNQVMQALSNTQQMPPEEKAFLIDALFAEQTLTRDIFRVFGKFNVDTLIPFPESIKNARFQQQAQQSSGSKTGSQNSVPTSNSLGSSSVPTMPTGGRG
jgi:hypothetical protein